MRDHWRSVYYGKELWPPLSKGGLANHVMRPDAVDADVERIPLTPWGPKQPASNLAQLPIDPLNNSHSADAVAVRGSLDVHGNPTIAHDPPIRHLLKSSNFTTSDGLHPYRQRSICRLHVQSLRTLYILAPA